MSGHYKTIVRYLLLLLAVGLVAAKSSRLVQSGSLPVDDFVQYWGASRLFLSSQDPYSPEVLGAMEGVAGYRGQFPLLMLNPPWTIPIILPFGILDYPVARIAWMMLNLALLLVSADCCWLLYGGEPRRRWVAWAASLTFLPAVFVLAVGQIGPLLLAGLAGFLRFSSRRCYGSAGAMLVLLAVKPHLLYLFWVALLLNTIRRRCWRPLAGAATAGLILSALPTIGMPEIWARYASLVSGQPPHELWISTTTGALLRQIFGQSNQWLQFLPMLVGGLWLALYWRRHESHWRWPDRVPALLFMSLATTPYAWAFDQVLLIPPLVQACVWLGRDTGSARARTTVLIYFAVSCVLMILVLRRVGPLVYLWVLPAWYVTYCLANREIPVLSRLNC